MPRLKAEHGIQSYCGDNKLRIAFDLDYAERYLSKGSEILEIGAFPYFLTLPLIDKAYRVTILDKQLGEAQPELMSEYGIEVRVGDLDAEPIQVEDGAFDAVIMNEVFEHLRMNLIFSMKEVYRVLRPGGRLLLSTPNLRSIRGLYNLLFKQEAYCSMGGIYNNYSHLETKNVMGHVREYTAKEVTDFLAKLGFAIDGVIYRGSYSGGFFWRMSHYATRIRPEFKPFFSVIARKPA